MDPATTMTVLNALKDGAIEILKPTAQQAVKDAYESLKKLVLRKFGNKGSLEPALTTLEGKPDSENRRLVLQEELASTGADRDQEVIQQASDLLVILRSTLRTLQ